MPTYVEESAIAALTERVRDEFNDAAAALAAHVANTTTAHGGPMQAPVPFSIRYLWATDTANTDPGNGLIKGNNATQTSITELRLDLLDTAGVSWATPLAAIAGSTNTTHRGYVQITHAADPTKWLLFNLTARTAATGYERLTVTSAGGSTASPFVANDPVIFSFVRTGNLGSTGAQGTAGGESVVMTFSTTTADADPGNGLVRFNNATLSSVTRAYFDLVTPGSADNTAWLDSLDDSTNPTNKAIITFARTDTPTTNFARYYITQVETVTGYRRLYLTYIGHVGSLSTGASALLVTVSRVGDRGADGTVGVVEVREAGTWPPASETAGVLYVQTEG